MNSLRPLIRLAWREVSRHKVRAALVVGLVALMVGSAVTAATIVRTTSPSAEDFIASEFGAADAILHIDGGAGYYGTAIEDLPDPLEPEVRPLDSNQVAEVAAAAENILGATSTIARSAWLTAGQRAGGPFGDFGGDGLNVAGLDLNDPVFDGRYVLLNGRLPEADDEVVLTPRASRANDAYTGGTITILGRELSVTGEVARAGTSYSGVGVVTPSGFDSLGLESHIESSTEILLSGVEQIPRNDLSGQIASLLDVHRDQIWLDTRQSFEDGFGYAYSHSGTLDAGRPEQLSTMIAALFAVQVALVAAAAFAVGVARRTRQFGQLQATGADNRQLQRIVLLEAAVSGILGSLIGAGVGVGLAAAAWSQGWLDTAGDRFPFDLRWNLIDLVGPAVVGVGAAVAAAWWPTRRLRSLAPASALADHIPITEPRVKTPIIGLFALVAGTLLLIAITGADYIYDSGDLGVALSVLAVLAMFGGALSCIGVIIHRIGERADRLPLLARIVARNSARHQARSWVAVAALVAVVVLPVVIGASTKAFPTSYASGVDENGWVQINVDSGGELDGRNDFFATLEERVDADVAPVQQFTVLSERSVDHGYRGYFDLVVESSDYWTGFGADAVSGTPEVLEAAGLSPSFWDSASSPEAVVLFGTGTARHVASSTLERDGIALTSEAIMVPFLQYETWVLTSPEVEGRFDLAMEARSLVFALGRRVNANDEAAISAIANDTWTSTVSYTPPAVENEFNYLSTRIDFGNDFGGPTPTQAAWIAIGIFTLLAVLISLVTSALSAVEVDKEISTMIAAGAPPSMRRRLLGAQTAYHLLLAALIGIPLAVLLFWAATRGDVSAPPGLTLPYTSMAVMAFIVPLVVGLAVALVFRNGRPAVSRRT